MKELDNDNHNSCVYESVATIAIALLATPGLNDDYRSSLADSLVYLMESSLKK